MNSSDIVQSVIQNDLVQATEQIHDRLGSMMIDALDQRKQTLAGDIFRGVEHSRMEG